MKKKVLSLFSGIGAFEKALQNLGIEFDLVNYCEIDKYASKSYSLIHNVSEDKNLIDVTKVNTDLLPTDLDLITYGFPCVPKGYMIKVENGYKAIEDITDNDLVLTHNNDYKRVVKTMSRVSDHINHIKLVGCQDLQLTDEHPLYVLRDGAFTWVKAKDLNTETDYLCYNINNKAIPCNYSDSILWLIGRYFADGYKENHSLHRPIFCIGKKKVEEFETYIKPFKFSIAHNERSAVEYRITDAYLCGIFSNLTTGSTTKEIPQWIVDLPKQQLEIFFKGYFSGDGHSRKDRELYMFCTASEKMFLSLQDIVIKLYSVVPTVSIRHDNRKATYNDTYNAQYSYRPKDQILKDNKVCVKIKDVVRELKEIEVFNFEVEEDNSYTVNNVIVHNCQDISQAGKQRGFEDAQTGERTRSGLFFEALRIIEDTKPKFAIAENVKALTSKKFEKEFKIVLDSLEQAGYRNFWKVLNAKDFGIPQNRERVFIISIRNDVYLANNTFIFPNKEPLQLRLKDLLQQEVEEKYYIKKAVNMRLTKNYIQYDNSGKGHNLQENRLYYQDGLCPTQPANNPSGDKTQIILMDKENAIQYVNKDVCKTIRTGGHGSVDRHSWDLVAEPEPKQIVEPFNTNSDGSCKTLKANYAKTSIANLTEWGAHGATGARVGAPAIIVHDIKQQVTVRKYEVDTESLKSVLKSGKANSGLTNSDIAQRLNVPITSVEHWFRNDNCFSIPPAEIWFKLKELLNITDAIFDKSITEFKTIDGKFDMADRVYNSQGISPTLTATAEPKIIDDTQGFDGVMTTEPLICASRGRNPEDPSDRTVGAPTEQRLEINTKGLSNTLTTVQKDNYVLEPQIIRDEPLQIEGWHRNATEVLNSGGICRTLSTQSNNLCTKVTDPINYRIRKLTPTECWRLMGFTDDDINKCIAGGLSNAQLYKQAGNSIVVQVLEKLLKALFDQTENEELQKFINEVLF